MTMYLPDGSVLPSHLGTTRTEAYDDDVFSNALLRIGEVTEIVYPDNKNSLSRQFIEYKVMVQHREGLVATTKEYTNCVLINPLAGLADRFHFTLRPSDAKNRNKEGLGLGSKVLILCINGENANAIIIGGIRDQQDKTEEKTKAKELGHHLNFIFNGISALIDKDGQLQITYTGKSDIDGNRNDDVDEKVVGTQLSFEKDGSWDVHTQDPDDEKKQEQFIRLDHDKKELQEQGKKLWQATVTDGKAKIVAKDGLHVGDATDATLLGKSFRDAQKQLHDQLKTHIKTAKQLFQQVGAQLTAAGGTPIPPGGTLPQLTVAGSLMLSAATIVEQMGQAIDNFEQQGQSKNGYLSKKNKSD